MVITGAKQNNIDWAGVLFAYPDINGDVHICEKQIQAAKDTKALVYSANVLGATLPTLLTAIKSNDEIRKDK